MTTIELVSYPGSFTDEIHDALAEITEHTLTETDEKYRFLATTIIRSYKYGLIMGKRMERARRKKNR